MQRREAVSIGLLGMRRRLPELVKRAKACGIVPDLVTDQLAHDRCMVISRRLECRAGNMCSRTRATRCFN